MANDTPATGKLWWKSKTVLMNFLALLALAVPAVAQWLKDNPVDAIAALSALNLLLRFATQGKVTWLTDDSGDASGSGGSGGEFNEGGYQSRSPGGDVSGRTWGFLPWQVGLACVLLPSLLVSCTAMKEWPITVGIEGEHGTYSYNPETGLNIAVKAPKVREEKSAPDVPALLRRRGHECFRERGEAGASTGRLMTTPLSRPPLYHYTNTGAGDRQP